VFKKVVELRVPYKMICEVESEKTFNDRKQVFEKNAFNKMESGERWFNDKKHVFEKNSFKKLCLFYF